MAKQVADYIQFCDFVCIEDYEQNRNQVVSYQTGEVGGMVREKLLNRGQHFALVNPRKLKSYVLRQKTVTKNDVIAWASERGFNPPVKTRSQPGYDKGQREDLADAFVLATMAQRLAELLDGTPEPRRGDIFLDPEFGLAFRDDLLFQ